MSNIAMLLYASPILCRVLDGGLGWPIKIGFFVSHVENVALFEFAKKAHNLFFRSVIFQQTDISGIATDTIEGRVIYDLVDGRADIVVQHGS